MNIVSILAAVVILGGDPSSDQPDGYSGSTAPERPRAGCDLSVDFKARKGEIDQPSYGRVKKWLSREDRVTAVNETSSQKDGSRKLCIGVDSKDAIRPMFKELTLVVCGSFKGPAPVRVQNRFGGLFDQRLRKPSASSFVARNNGLRQSPPVDKWN